MTIIFRLIFLVKVKLVMLQCHAIFWGRGIEGEVCGNNANCFLVRMANLLNFIGSGGI